MIDTGRQQLHDFEAISSSGPGLFRSTTVVCHRLDQAGTDSRPLDRHAGRQSAPSPMVDSGQQLDDYETISSSGLGLFQPTTAVSVAGWTRPVPTAARWTGARGGSLLRHR